MPKFDPFAEDLRETLPSELSAALIAAPMQSLREGPADPELATLIQNPVMIDSIDRVTAGKSDQVRSALWLAAGDLDRSHEISQNIGSAEGSFLHGIMHRREGDFGNSKYWFRRAGSHAIEATIASESGQKYSSATEFVDQCQHAFSRGGGDSDDIESLQHVQWIELQAMIRWLVG